MNQYIPFDGEQAQLEQAYLNDLKYARIGKSLAYASSELDRLIKVLRGEEADLKSSLNCKVKSI